VDEKALAVALTEGRLRGAALDVYEIEPAATSHKFEDPIPSAPHVYGTHHVGASTEQAQEAVADEVVKIIKQFRGDGTVLHCVNQHEPAKVTKALLVAALNRYRWTLSPGAPGGRALLSVSRPSG
jgi:D-3-phosphoglycerate dehydrogenase